MKKLTIDIVRGLLCLIVKSFLVCMFISLLLIMLLTANSSSAQGTRPAGILVGHKLPDKILHSALTKVSNDTLSTVMLKDFEGKAVILDFWTSWCAPCLRAMPGLDQIYAEKRGSLQVLMINCDSSHKGFESSIAFIRKFMHSNPSFSTPLLLNNKDLISFFAISEVPHYIWIGADGYVKAITSEKEITSDNIDAFLSGATLSLTSKTK